MNVESLPPAILGSADRLRAWGRRGKLRARLAVRALGPVLRRTIDVAVASLGLLAVLPLLVVVALLIKLESRGPVFYAQERIGKNGRTFRIWKLRSMVTNADALRQALVDANRGKTDSTRFKLRRDPRVTRVGRIIRKLSIDELPQLLNMLTGDMTLVGPRPPIRKEVALYSPRAMRRLEVKPGMTCLWQVRGRSDLDFDQQVSLDLEYIDSVSPASEVKIVIATVPAVITGKGAY